MILTILLYIVVYQYSYSYHPYITLQYYDKPTEPLHLCHMAMELRRSGARPLRR